MSSTFKQAGPALPQATSSVHEGPASFSSPLTELNHRLDHIYFKVSRYVNSGPREPAFDHATLRGIRNLPNSIKHKILKAKGHY